MGVEQEQTAGRGEDTRCDPPRGAPEFPVREYIGAMAAELAQMARWDGDEALGRLLDTAAVMSADIPNRREVERSSPPATPRPA